MSGFNDPLSDPEELPRFRFLTPRRMPRAATASVFLTTHGTYLVEWPEQPLTQGELAFGGLRTRYEVDIAEHPLAFTCELPCKQDHYNFRAEVSVVWKVHDPIVAVKRKLHDVEAELRPLLERRMRLASREFEVTRQEDAENWVNATLGDHPQLDNGLTVCQAHVALGLTEDAEPVRGVERDIGLHPRQAELDTMRAEHELGLRKRRMAFYREAIESGNATMLALQLADHPDDSRLVAQIMRDATREDMERNLRVFEAMLEANRLEAFELDDTRKLILRNLVDDLRAGLRARSVGGKAPAGLEPSGEERQPEALDPPTEDDDEDDD